MKTNSILKQAIVVTSLLLLIGCGEKNKTSYDVQPHEQRIINIEDVSPQIDKESGNNSSSTQEKLNIDGTVKQIDYKQPTENNSQDKRMIIRSGIMSLEIDKFEDTEAKIKETANRYNGYITNTTSNLNASNKRSGTITVRVQADKFDAMLGELSKLGKVMNQNISGKDVTEEFMDAEARMKTQQELESRLLKLLAEKTASLTSVVEVEQKLANVRENIEKTQGRMRFLKDQSSYSTLTVSVYEPSMLNTSTGGGFFYELGQSVKKGLEGFTKVLSGMITVIIAFLPIIALGGLVIYFVRRYLKKRKLAKATA